MGRNKIKIQKISETRTRQVTFTKRKNGLYKKLMELSILCNAQIGLVMFNESGRLFQYASNGDVGSLLQRYQVHQQSVHEKRTNKDLYTQYYGNQQTECKESDSQDDSTDSKHFTVQTQYDSLPQQVQLNDSSIAVPQSKSSFSSSPLLLTHYSRQNSVEGSVSGGQHLQPSVPSPGQFMMSTPQDLFTTESAAALLSNQFDLGQPVGLNLSSAASAQNFGKLGSAGNLLSSQPPHCLSTVMQSLPQQHLKFDVPDNLEQILSRQITPISSPVTGPCGTQPVSELQRTASTVQQHKNKQLFWQMYGQRRMCEQMSQGVLPGIGRVESLPILDNLASRQADHLTRVLGSLSNTSAITEELERVACVFGYKGNAHHDQGLEQELLMLQHGMPIDHKPSINRVGVLAESDTYRPWPQ